MSAFGGKADIATNGCDYPNYKLTTVHKRCLICSLTNSGSTKMLAIRHLKVVSPSNEKRTVEPPVRLPNSEYRTREYLTEQEVEKLIEAAKDNRWGQRDSTMVLMAYRHGLRVSELVDLRWEQVDLDNAILHVRRVKHGTPATHPLTGVELSALCKLQRDQKP